MNERTDRLIDRVAIGTSIALLAVFAATLATSRGRASTGALGAEPPAPEPAYAAGAAIDTPKEWYQRGAVHAAVLRARELHRVPDGAAFLQAPRRTTSRATSAVVLARGDGRGVKPTRTRISRAACGRAGVDAIRTAVPGLRRARTPHARAGRSTSGHGPRRLGGRRRRSSEAIRASPSRSPPDCASYRQLLTSEPRLQRREVVDDRRRVHLAREPVSASSASGHGCDCPIFSIASSRAPASLLS